MPFSVGDGGGALVGVVVVVVVVVVDVEGAFSLLAHPAVNAPIAMRAPAPATAIKRRVDNFELMIWILSVRLRLGGFWDVQPTIGSLVRRAQAEQRGSKPIRSFLAEN
jgi:hypothetical protein